MSKGSRLGVDADTPRPAGLDDYPLVDVARLSFPNEIGRAGGTLATRSSGQAGSSDADAFQEAYGDSLDLDLLRQYAELYAELTGTMLVSAGDMGVSGDPFVADAGWDAGSQQSWTDQPEPSAQPLPAAADHGTTPERPDFGDQEELNPVLSALGFFDDIAHF